MLTRRVLLVFEPRGGRRVAAVHAVVLCRRVDQGPEGTNAFDRCQSSSSQMSLYHCVWEIQIIVRVLGLPRTYQPPTYHPPPSYRSLLPPPPSPPPQPPHIHPSAMWGTLASRRRRLMQAADGVTLPMFPSPVPLAMPSAGCLSSLGMSPRLRATASVGRSAATSSRGSRLTDSGGRQRGGRPVPVPGGSRPAPEYSR